MSAESSQGPLTFRGFLMLVGVVLVCGVMIFAGVTESKRPKIPTYFEGVITAKEWVKATDETTIIMVYDPGTGLTNPIPIFTHHPEKWKIYIGKASITVPKDEFKKIEIGEAYSNRPKERKP